MVPQNRKSDTALFDALRIRSNVSVERLSALLSQTSVNLEVLDQCLPTLEKQLPAIIDQIHASHPEMADVALQTNEFNLSTDLLQLLKSYIKELLVNNEYNEQYVRNRIALIVHYKNIGVPTLTFVQFIDTLRHVLLQYIEKIPALSPVKESISSAIRQLLQFDLELCVDINVAHFHADIEALRKEHNALRKNIETKIAQRTKDLMEQVRLDPLTKIYNISAMQEMLDKELALAKRRHTKLSLVYFDVDHFKRINDTEGHLKGDEVLQEIGQTLRQCVRQTDIACRYGGDEFCVVLLECNALEAQKVCEKLIATFQSRYPTYSFSMGIAETGASEFVSVKQLIHLADQKMYLAKKEAGYKIVL